MFLNKRKAIFLISVLTLIFILTINQVKSQTIKIVDGDTIHLNGEKIRFTGIDTPELKQTCFKDSVKDPCGVTAKQMKVYQAI
jgi:endonuclease YncB( thermonuclease family)